MAELNVQFINPFLMAASSIIKDTCQFQLKVGKPYIRTTKLEDDSIVVMLGVTGEMGGRVMLSMSISTACQVASRMMMGMPVADLDDMALSAISELGNMVMGNAATILAGQGVGIDITPPTLCRGNLIITSASEQNICIPLVSEEGHEMKMDIAVRKV